MAQTLLGQVMIWVPETFQEMIHDQIKHYLLKTRADWIVWEINPPGTSWKASFRVFFNFVWLGYTQCVRQITLDDQHHWCPSENTDSKLGF